MGAEKFGVYAEGPDVETTFRAAVEQAQYDYGHAGYSGTIAEKSEYRLYELPPNVDVKEFEAAANNFNFNKNALPEWAKQWSDFESAVNAYDDKWGPAVAFQTGPNAFVFIGYASS